MTISTHRPPDAQPAALPSATVERVQLLLRQRFSAGGCTGRAGDFARLPLEASPAVVEEALQSLWEQGLVELHCLADGTTVFSFPRR